MMNARWRIHPLFAVILAVAIWAGYGRETLLFLAVLGIHELAHLVAARAFGLQLVEFELMPYGGMARIAGLEQVEPAKEAIVALAGPLCNLAVLAVSLLLASLLHLQGAGYSLWLSAHATLAVVNLIPALPLDGGRIVRGALAARYGHDLAKSILLRCGRICACLLIAAGILAALLGFAAWTLPFIGVFLWLRTRDEDHSAFRAMRDLWEKNERFITQGGMEVRQIVVPGSLTVNRLRRRLRPDHYHLILVADDSLHVEGSIYEEDVLEALLAGRGESPLRSLIDRSS